MAATKQIRHMVRFNATPRAIYRALMDSKKHAAFTGAPAKIDPKVGGRFAAWGQHLCGVNVELIKNKRIVQAWRAQNWPAGHAVAPAFGPIVCWHAPPAVHVSMVHVIRSSQSRFAEHRPTAQRPVTHDSPRRTA